MNRTRLLQSDFGNVNHAPDSRYIAIGVSDEFNMRSDVRGDVHFIAASVHLQGRGFEVLILAITHMSEPA